MRLIIPALLFSVTYLLVTAVSANLGDWSVTTINIASGVIAITLGAGLAVAGAMANDSGKGGLFIHTFQWMSLGYPLIFLIGLIGSITLLYSDYDDRNAMAVGLASMNLVWLVLIAILMISAVLLGHLEEARRHRKRAREIENQIKPYLIHLPHCGTLIPDEYRHDYLLSQEALQNNVLQYADLFTDELYAPLLERFGGVTSQYSRLFFDPERYFDDAQEKMSQYGLGWFYERAILENTPLRGRQNKEVIAEYYHKHHEELTRKIQEKLDLFGSCTIIDCHSFSNERYWFHDSELALPDICIGYDEEHVDMELVEIVKDAFASYNVAVNTPYSGSLVPPAFYKKNKNVRSVMIEINKKLYLDASNNKGSDFDAIRFTLEMVMDRLVFERNYKVA